MRAIALLVVLGLAAFTNADSGSASTSTSTETDYTYIEYTGFEKMFVSFVSEMAIVFNFTAYDIVLKLNEFSTMPGIQPILALSTLYGEYIPAYAVDRYRHDILIRTFPKLVQKGNPNKVQIAFTQNQMDIINTAWKTIENSDVLAIDGILDRMHGLESMVYNPKFKFNDEYIFMPSSIASNFYDTFSNWQLGNEAIVTSLQGILDLDLDTLNAQQNNPYSQYVLKVWFKFMEGRVKIQQKITDTIKEIVSAAPSTDESTYTAKVATQVASVMSQANKMSSQFMNLAGICTTLEDAIVNPPPITSNESS